MNSDEASLGSSLYTKCSVKMFHEWIISIKKYEVEKIVTLEDSFIDFLACLVPDLHEEIPTVMIFQSSVLDLNNDRAVFKRFMVVASVSNFI